MQDCFAIQHTSQIVLSGTSVSVKLLLYRKQESKLDRARSGAMNNDLDVVDAHF